jgi:endonuclease YncB( thermonuclease family)
VTRDRAERKAVAATTIPFDSETCFAPLDVHRGLAGDLRRARGGRAVLQRPARVPGEPVTGSARVIDGDSLEIAGVRVRLHGIDAPEREQDCRDANGKTYSCGRAAMRALMAAVAGRSVTCTPVQVDQYNRDVALCTVDDLDLGEAMVRGGHALDYARHSRGRYAEAEREARTARRGLWAGTFETPATWRQQNANR